MMNSSNDPETDSDAGTDSDKRLSQFETKLREQSLGAGPQQRGKLLYECGYAAGVAEAQKRLLQATQRWRVVGVAASLAACALFVIQLRLFDSSSSRHVVVERPANPDQIETVTPKRIAASGDWLAQLAIERSDVGDNGRMLRVSSSIPVFSEPNDAASELTPMGPFDQESTLQPRDFQKFL